MNAKDDIVSVFIPMQLARRGCRKEIVLPEGRPANAPPSSLAVAVAKAFKWQEMLDDGTVSSVKDLARKLKIDQGYVSRIMRLTALAPDIVKAILEGKDVAGTSIETFRKDIPLFWKDQR